MRNKLRRIRHHTNTPVKSLQTLLGLKTAPAYFKKETGAVGISVEEALQLAGFFHITIKDLFGQEEQYVK